MSTGGQGLSGGTAAPVGGTKRKFPGTNAPSKAPVFLGRGARSAGGEPYNGPLDRVGANSVGFGIANRQRPLPPQAPRRSQNTGVVDLSGILINGSSRDPKAPLGGGAETDGKRRRIDQLAVPSQSIPNPFPANMDMTRLSKDNENLTFFGGAPPHSAIESDFYRGTQMPLQPNTAFDNNYQNMGPGGLVYPGTASQDMFIDIGDRGRASRVAANPLTNMAFDASATSKFETKSVTGAPNAVVPYTHRVSNASLAWMPEEQRCMPLFSAIKVKDIPETSHLNQFETRYAPLPFHDDYNLVAVNLALALSQDAPLSLADIPQPEEVLSNYHFMGAVRTDEGSRSYPQANTSSSRKQRNLVFVANGPADMFNIWDSPKVGQSLYFILKGVPLHSIRAHSGAPSGTYNISAANPEHVESVGKRAPVVLQFVPWCDPEGYRSPSMADLAYHDSAGILRYGVPIRIGHLMQYYPKKINKEIRNHAPYSVHAMMNSGQIRVQLEIRQAP